MQNIKLKTAEKVILAVAALLLLVIVAGVVWLMRKPVSPAPASTVAAASSEGLTEGADHFPADIVLGERLPYTDFTDENGAAVSLDAYAGKTIILTFWASWCPYCNAQMETLKGFEGTLAGYNDVVYLLLDKLDGKKETLQSANDYAAQHQLPWKILYDDGLKAYSAWGMKIVPTTIVLDKKGLVKTCHAGEIKSEAEMQALLDYAIDGGSGATERFITQKLMGEDGGVHVNYLNKTGDSPIGYDVLSETQGLVMDYAALSGNKPLFDKAYGYLKTALSNEKGLNAWLFSASGGAAASNALIDDLRIFRVLKTADAKWGSYDKAADAAGKAILTYNVTEGHLVDLYDVSTDQRAKRFTLCYADFEAIGLLGEGSALYENTLSVVENGYIGDACPLYYKAYDYEKQAYDTGSLNTSEALYTLYHLAKVDKLKPQSVAWLKDQLKSGGLKARYNTDGTVTSGYDYHSTAVYALLGLIAHTIDDKALLTEAITGMERYRINAAGDALNGAFGNRTGSDINAFDECMPLLLYGELKADGF